MGSYTIHSLSKDLLAQTFSYLDLWAIGQCAKTCKVWRDITQNDGFWKLVCNALGYSDPAYPNCSWKTSCKIYEGRIFSRGEVSTSTIPMRSWIHLFHARIEPAVYENRLAFYRPESDKFEIWNLSESVCTHQLRTSEKEVLTPWNLSILWDEKGHLQLNSQYLVYVLNIDWEKRVNVYIWSIEDKGDLPSASFSLDGLQAGAQLSNSTVFIHSWNTPQANYDGLDLSVFDLTNLTTLDKQHSPSPAYNFCSDDDDLEQWNEIPKAFYQNKVFYFKDCSYRDLAKVDIETGKKRNLENPYTPPNVTSYISLARVDGKYISTIRWSEEKSTGWACSFIEIWDLEGYKFTHKKIRLGKKLTPDSTCLNVEKELMIIKSGREISIHDYKIHQEIRTIALPNTIPQGPLYSFQDGIIILGDKEVFTIKFS